MCKTSASNVNIGNINNFTTNYFKFYLQKLFDKFEVFVDLCMCWCASTHGPQSCWKQGVVETIVYSRWLKIGWNIIIDSLQGYVLSINIFRSLITIQILVMRLDISGSESIWTLWSAWIIAITTLPFLAIKP